VRQVFTSQRLETVEGVAKLLTDAGIEVYISRPRSYKSKRGSQFSYNDPVVLSQQSALWVRHAEDQPRARELLRAAGLLETTRPGSGPSLSFAETVEEPAPRRSWAWRIRLMLLAVIAAAAVLTVVRHRAPPSQQAPVAAPVTPVESPQPGATPAPAPPAQEEDEVRIQIRPPSE
jgi:hypothetical protein